MLHGTPRLPCPVLFETCHRFPTSFGISTAHLLPVKFPPIFFVLSDTPPSIPSVSSHVSLVVDIADLFCEPRPNFHSPFMSVEFTSICILNGDERLTKLGVFQTRSGVRVIVAFLVATRASLASCAAWRRSGPKFNYNHSHAAFPICLFSYRFARVSVDARHFHFPYTTHRPAGRSARQAVCAIRDLPWQAQTVFFFLPSHPRNNTDLSSN